MNSRGGSDFISKASASMKHFMFASSRIPPVAPGSRAARHWSCVSSTAASIAAIRSPGNDAGGDAGGDANGDADDVAGDDAGDAGDDDVCVGETIDGW